jgi:hypothetical protein
MAQGAVIGRSIRDVFDDIIATLKTTGKNRRSRSVAVESITEACLVRSEFGGKLDQRMSAYSGDLHDLGRPGDTADHWRAQLTIR